MKILLYTLQSWLMWSCYCIFTSDLNTQHFREKNVEKHILIRTLISWMMREWYVFVSIVGTAKHAVVVCQTYYFYVQYSSENSIQMTWRSWLDLYNTTMFLLFYCFLKNATYVMSYSCLQQTKVLLRVKVLFSLHLNKLIVREFIFVA